MSLGGWSDRSVGGGGQPLQNHRRSHPFPVLEREREWVWAICVSGHFDRNFRFAVVVGRYGRYGGAWRAGSRPHIGQDRPAFLWPPWTKHRPRHHRAPPRR